MLALLAGLGYGSFVVVSLVVGVRLLMLWRRTHETPELAISVTLVSGGLSYAIAIAAYTAQALLSRAGVAVLETASAFCAHLATAALALALRHLFRPESSWARALQLSLTVALAGSFALRLVDPLAFPPPGFVFWPYVSFGAIAYAWGIGESLHAHRETARLAQVGLAEPDAARRFLLWAMAGASALGIYGIAMLNRLQDAAVMPPWMIATTSALGLVAAIGLSLAFFPARRLRARALATRSDAAA